MNIKLFDFEKNIFPVNTEIDKKIAMQKKERINDATDVEINDKYKNMSSRIITESGSIKLDLLNQYIDNKKYILKPDFQRRKVWNNKKRSRLIESFIMNIPVPPVFLYETEFDEYEVMDGLQRLSAISDFFKDKFQLEGLESWNELNGKQYSDLPEIIKKSIERRQISLITLLKETTNDKEIEEKIKKTVFERLNTGGEKLRAQEIRNALFQGKFNDLCLKLSKNEIFKKLWGIKDEIIDEAEDEFTDDEKPENNFTRHMDDVEIVLRFFAMRNINNFNISLSAFLDSYLKFANKLKENQVAKLEEKFISSIQKVYNLFGEKSFCKYTKKDDAWVWEKPQRMIYDPIMLAVDDFDILPEHHKIEKNIKILEKKYIENENKSEPINFSGKAQSKKEIEKRTLFFIDVIETIIKGC